MVFTIIAMRLSHERRFSVSLGDRDSSSYIELKSSM